MNEGCKVALRQAAMPPSIDFLSVSPTGCLTEYSTPAGQSGLFGRLAQCVERASMTSLQGLGFDSPTAQRPKSKKAIISKQSY
jgi:hypothetical protein